MGVARARRGPLRSRWSFGFEVVNRAQKRFHERVAKRSPQRERRAWASLRSQGRAWRRCRSERRELGGVPTLFIDPPESAREDRVILYLHGGSFMYGSERSHGELCARIALATGARVVFPLYRLCPEHPFPAALDDARAAWEALVATGVDPARAVIAGDSAGGNLTLALLVVERDAGSALPAGAVAISPWVDLAARGGSLERNEPYDWASPWMQERWARAYLPAGASRRDPRVSPAHADLAGLPDLCVLVGDAELLHDQVVAFAGKAERAGVRVALHVALDMTHLWLSLPFEASEIALREIDEFVRSRTGEAPSAPPATPAAPGALPAEM